MVSKYHEIKDKWDSNFMKRFCPNVPILITDSRHHHHRLCQRSFHKKKITRHKFYIQTDTKLSCTVVDTAS